MSADYQDKGRITAGEIADVMEVVKTSILRRAEKEGWKYEKGKNRARQYVITALPADIQKALLNKKYGGSELSIEELAEQFRIDVPPEKLDDPGMASKVRMVVDCLAIPQAKGRKKRIREIAEGYGYNVGTAYRFLDRVKKGKPLLKAQSAWRNARRSGDHGACMG